MATTILATRMPQATRLEFEAKTRRLGISPQAAVNAFIARFNEEDGFPFALKNKPYTDFKTEDEVMNWSEDMTNELWSDDEAI
ncbi:MAG: hypothetical protein LBM12_00080 [Candidatus Nomurabacteria bacterium]|jgi:antitoxin component of RelBE/YafQ-DinJ toxin-antitoxin module|nr:hypothetical protein [Candidatus Nomurabacteria bacterium]